MSNLDTIKYLELKNLYPWKLRVKAARQRCNDINSCNYKWYGGRGIKCELSFEDAKFLWFRDKAYNMKRPSLDRFVSTKNYTIDNCQFIEHNDNVIKRNKKQTISILMMSKSGVILKQFQSIMDAAREINRCSSSIQDALKGRSPRCAGYYWKYADK